MARRRAALGTRISIVLTAIVAVAMILSGTTCFLAMHRSLRGEVDSVLRDEASALTRQPIPRTISVPQLQTGLDALNKQGGGAATSVFQIIAGDGRTPIKPSNAPGFALTAGDRTIAQRPRGTTALTDRTVGGQHFRVITIAPSPGRASRACRSAARCSQSTTISTNSRGCSGSSA